MWQKKKYEIVPNIFGESFGLHKKRRFFFFIRKFVDFIFTLRSERGRGLLGALRDL